MQQVSGITRKRLAFRAVERLEKTQGDVGRLQENLLRLQAIDTTQQERMEEHLQEHQKQSQALSKCRHQVMMLHDRLQDHELVIQEHEQAAEAATTRVSCC
jgi:predicted nuclease with TOPRIM domain